MSGNCIVISAYELMNITDVEVIGSSTKGIVYGIGNYTTSANCIVKKTKINISSVERRIYKWNNESGNTRNFKL